MIKNKTSDYYILDIGGSNEAILSVLDFEGATKKSKPILEVGQIVYCRVLENNKFMRYSYNF